VRRYLEEVVNDGGMHLLADLVAPDYVGHEPHGDHYGPEGLRIVVADYRDAFPDLRLTFEDLVTQGDKVVYRFVLRGTHTGSFMGIPASGRPVIAGGIAIGHLAGGKLAESWVCLDALNLLRQLGAAPPHERGREYPHSQAPN
jgi:steroid delta-isomerase-like uncharacterized protein